MFSEIECLGLSIITLYRYVSLFDPTLTFVPIHLRVYLIFKLQSF